jgi:putative hydrolase of HD superfamily
MENLVHFFYEMGLLKRIRRSGWWVAGIDDPESVAEHSFRTAILGYVLATMEGADPLRTAAICLFHDIHEARIGDLHRVNTRYLDPGQAEGKAFEEQAQRLPPGTAESVVAMVQEGRCGTTLEARLARDADLLECLIQAREYQAQGCSSVTDWIQNARLQLRSTSARRLADTAMEVDPKAWWHDLKKNAWR